MISRKILVDSERIRREFQAARPFKHIYLADFLEQDVAETLLQDFPAFDRAKALNEFGEVGRKAVNTKLQEISPFYKRFYEYLFSEEFLGAMSAISGIPDLIGDITLYGGGTHENLNAQELDPHVDFNYAVGSGGAHRRMNLLVYLNKGWCKEWGGAIELHSNPRDPDTNKITSFNVDFNKALLFETNEYSWHGFQRIRLPAGMANTLSRKCISIYLYSKTRPADEIAGTHGTFYVQRPLAHRFKPGYRLTEQDVGELVANYRGRDRQIEFYQKQEEQFGRKLKEVGEIVAEHDKHPRIPVVGFAKFLSVNSGQIWSDGWASKQFCIEFKAVRELVRIDFRVTIPDSAPPGTRHFRVEANGGGGTFETTGHGSFSFSVPVSVPPNSDFTVTVECDRDFSPSVLGKGADVRRLSYLLEEIVAETLNASHCPSD